MQASNQLSKSAGGGGGAANRIDLENNMDFQNQRLISILNKLKYLFENPAYKSLAELSKLMRLLFDKYSFGDNKQLMLDSSFLIKAVKQFDYELAPYSGDVIDAINRLYDSFQNNFVRFYVDENVICQPQIMSPGISSASFIRNENNSVQSINATTTVNNSNNAANSQAIIGSNNNGTNSANSSTAASNILINSINNNNVGLTQHPVSSSVGGLMAPKQSSTGKPVTIQMPHSTKLLAQQQQTTSAAQICLQRPHPQSATQSNVAPSAAIAAAVAAAAAASATGASTTAPSSSFMHHLPHTKDQYQIQQQHYSHQRQQYQPQIQQQPPQQVSSQSTPQQQQQQQQQTKQRFIVPQSNYVVSHSMHPHQSQILSQQCQNMTQNYAGDNMFDPIEEELFKYEVSLRALLEQSKQWSKHAKDMLKYFEYRAQCEIDYYKNVKKISNFIQFESHLRLNEFHLYPLSTVFYKFGRSEDENARKSLISYEEFQKEINSLKSAIAQYDKEIKKVKERFQQRNQKRNDAIERLSKFRSNLYQTTIDQQKMFTGGSRDSRKIKYSSNSDDNRSQDSVTDAIKTENEQTEKENMVANLRQSFIILVSHIKKCSLNYFDTLNNSMSYDRQEVQTIQNLVSNSQQGMIDAYYSFVREFVSKQPQLSEISSNNQAESDSDSNLGSNRPVKLEIDDPRIYKNQLQQSRLNRAQSKVFGVSLCDLPSTDVPEIVQQCVEQIEERGQHANGIYRVSGAKSKIDSLIKDFENNPKSIQWDDLSANVVANVLKCYLRELPEPLLTFDLYGEFIKIAKNYTSAHSAVKESNDDIVTSLRKVVQKMPKVHYNTLKFLMRHLRKISHNCAVNSMPPSNLGIIFGPTLLKSNLDTDSEISNSLYDTCHQTRVVELLILYANEIFDMTDDYDDDGGGDADDDDDNAVNDNSGGVRRSRTSGHGLNRTSRSQYNHRPHGPQGTQALFSQPSGNDFVSRGLAKSATTSFGRTGMMNSPTKRNNMERERFFRDNISSGGGAMYSHTAPGSSFNKSKQANIFDQNVGQATVSPFTRVALAGPPSRAYNQAKFSGQVQRSFDLPNFDANRQRAATPEKPPRTTTAGLYGKSSEMSRSSSSLYSPNLSFKSSEDLV